MPSLKQRFELLQNEQPEITQADLARATGAKPPSVNAWFTGETKSMKAETAAIAASLYGVNSLWLATGKGPKKPQGIINRAMAGISPAGGLDSVSNRDSIQKLGEHFKTMSPGRKAAILSLLAEYEKDPDRITKEIEMLLGGGGDDSTIR